MNRKDELLKRIDTVIEMGQKAVASSGRISPQPPMVTPQGKPAPYTPPPIDVDWVDNSLSHSFRTAGLAVLYDLFTDNSPHYRDFESATMSNARTSQKGALAIVQTVRNMLNDGWILSVRKLVARDFFRDVLATGKYLLGEGHKDPAAVMIGGALEAHLRELASLFGIPLTTTDAKGRVEPRTAQPLNQDLYTAGVYSLVDSQHVTAWLSLRNNAAHAKFNEYTEQQVKNMFDGVQDFITRHTI